MSNDSNVLPVWQPPVGLGDPFVRRLDMDRARWMRALRGRIPKAFDALVAAFLGTYGNKDGSRCHPGVARLAEDVNLSESTAKRSLAWLAEHGWITLVEQGNSRAGLADVYQLSLPAPLAADMGLWGEHMGAQWMNRPAGEPKRPGVRGRPDPMRKNQQRQRSPETAEPIGGLQEASEVYKEPLEVPVGTYHQNLPTRTSLTKPIVLDRPLADARGSLLSELDPDDGEYIEAVHQHIEEQLGGPMHPTVTTMVDGMISAGAHWKMIVRTALARERESA